MNGADGRRDLLTPSVLNPDSIAAAANDKNEFQKAMNGDSGTNGSVSATAPSAEAAAKAASRVSKVLSQAGSGLAFEGQTLGVGGLDDVLVQIKRRIWTPLAAPPQLLNGKFEMELCIEPEPQKFDRKKFRNKC